MVSRGSQTIKNLSSEKLNLFLYHHLNLTFLEGSQDFSFRQENQTKKLTRRKLKKLFLSVLNKQQLC